MAHFSEADIDMLVRESDLNMLEKGKIEVLRSTLDYVLTGKRKWPFENAAAAFNASPRIYDLLQVKYALETIDEWVDALEFSELMAMRYTTVRTLYTYWRRQ